MFILCIVHLLVYQLGSLHVLALTEGGEVYAWGDNDEGQLGDGTQHPISRPRPIAALKVNYYLIHKYLN